jgi:Hydrazine synthase alpha subunit middle domain/WD40-like Beta Propeller Repeat
MSTEAVSRSGNNARRGRAVLAAAFAALAAGCGGGGDGSVGVGSGQDPDPVAIDFPIAYTKGPLLDDQMQMQQSTDLRELVRFNVGTDLYLRDRASPTAIERNITIGETQGLGDVMGLDIAADGTKVLFAMRGPFDPNLAIEDQPTWNIWEYEIATQTLRRIIASDITAEAGQDIWPRYLPDGRILFVSTRQRQAKAILLDEGKPQFDALVDHARQENRDDPAFVLHVMNSDGSDIHQISFNQSHDLDPSVLSTGQVLFSRWDHAGGNDGIHLYRVNPDGTGLELLYGAESHLTGTNGSEIEFIDAREMPDGRIMAVLRPFDQPELGGDVAIIDTSTYVENTQPTAANQGMMGPAQVSATTNQVRTDNLPSQGGRFGGAFPLWDGTGRVLVSWAICRLVENNVIVPCDAQSLADPNAQSAPPFYGIWIYDPLTQTQLPIVTGEEGVLIGEVVAAQPRALPQSIPDKVSGVDLDADLVAENVGILDIRSVYDVDGVDSANPDIATLADPAQHTAAERPARFLRLEKAVSIPSRDVRDFDNSAFGVNAGQGMREILGYAPIEPDGSVRIKVPANVAFGISVLDANGRRISQRHQNWLQLMPGEERTCNGCHSTASGLSHGRDEAFASAYAGATTTGQPFPNTDPALFADFGETMAEARTRLSCASDCAVLNPSVDLSYEDVWTDETAAGRLRDLAFTYRYADLDTPPPTSVACVSSWSATCRIVINYEQHIHPLWGLTRQILDTDGVTVLADHTCTQGGCHAPVDAMNATAVPAAQLDLTDGPSPDVAEQFNAYRELLAQDFAQEVVNGALQDIVIDIGPDANGNPILVNVPVAPSMSTAGANASNRFFSRFDVGGSHEGYLTPAELRLISEWLDIGGQYYNNPFDAPVN